MFLNKYIRTVYRNKLLHMRSENIKTNELQGKTNYKVNFLLIAPSDFASTKSESPSSTVLSLIEYTALR